MFASGGGGSSSKKGQKQMRERNIDVTYNC